MKLPRTLNIAFILLLIITMMIVAKMQDAKAQAPDNNPVIPGNLTSQEQAINWLNNRGLDFTPTDTSQITIKLELQSIAVASCDQIPPIQRNSNHTGALDANTSNVIVFNGYWIAEANLLCMQVGSDWWGYNETPARLYGMVTLRDAQADTLVAPPYPFDLTGTPDVELTAIQTIFSHQFELGHNSVRIIWEGNIVMEGSLPATKVVSTVVTPNSGTVILEKTGNPIEGTVWELLKLNPDSSRTMIERIEVSPYHIQSDGSAKLNWNNLSGPIEAATPNYIIQERIDLQPGPMRVIPRDLVTGVETWIWYLSLDASLQTTTVRAYNPLYQVYLPVCFKSGPGGPIETLCPTDVADVLINQVIIRQNDDSTGSGYPYALPTLHPQQTLEFRLGKLLDKGYTPQLVQLYVDNKPYGHYDVNQRDHIFTTMISGGNEREYELNAYKIYVLHVQIIIGHEADGSPIYCYLRWLFYVDPPETH